MGQLSMRVDSQLVGNDMVAPELPFNVYIRGSDSFELSGLYDNSAHLKVQPDFRVPEITRASSAEAEVLEQSRLAEPIERREPPTENKEDLQDSASPGLKQPRKLRSRKKSESRDAASSSTG